MFGVAKCLKEHGLHTQARFSGCSAGALTALGLCIEPSSYDKAVVRGSPLVCLCACVNLLHMNCMHSPTSSPPISPQEYCKAVCIPRCRGTLLGPFLIHKYVEGCLEYTGCLDEHWESARHKLSVAVTALPDFRAVRVSDFASKDDLVSALLASAAAFPLAPPVRRQGKWLIDGGISDFQPLLDSEATVTVNPFYFSQVSDQACVRRVAHCFAFIGVE